MGVLLLIVVTVTLSVIVVVNLPKILGNCPVKVVTNTVTKYVTESEVVTVTTTAFRTVTEKLTKVVTSVTTTISTSVFTLRSTVFSTITSILVRTAFLTEVVERTATVTSTSYVSFTRTVTVTSTHTVWETLVPSYQSIVTSTAIFVNGLNGGVAIYSCTGKGVMILGKTMTIIRGYPKPINFDYFVPCPALILTESNNTETVFLSGTLTFKMARVTEAKLLNLITLTGVETFTNNFLLVYPVTSTLALKCDGNGVVVGGRKLIVGYPVQVVNVVGSEFHEPCPCYCLITEKGPLTLLAVGSGTLTWG
ncbi:hypothetical protein EYM_02040 [Ignicoccus islandicus DSM 13165]|uniref:Uncharacterized protein n=1 Tax=Ignicoccus islandicus DSM 13165 TaxID=940295 RepID=A0A0U3FK67_9CREN|nr:hypothetical protein [Ignicoccus islandicus]ALU12278.1 hypothetical protein EYM_02040 [Ignicoccus islandicus DSM 13165]